MARRPPFATPEKRVAANAVRNRPPNNPSRGPVGLMVRQTPNNSNLKCFIFYKRSFTFFFYFYLYLETPKADENIEDTQDTQKSINWSISFKPPLQLPMRSWSRPLFSSLLFSPDIIKMRKRKAVGVASRNTSRTPTWLKWSILSFEALDGSFRIFQMSLPASKKWHYIFKKQFLFNTNQKQDKCSIMGKL